MPEIIQGTPLPLFDRLATVLPVEEQGVILDSMAGIQASIHRDLMRLFNTRSHTQCEKYLTEDLTVLDFGIPEIGVLGTLSGADQDMLQKIISKAIQSFEPRLTDVKVQVQPMTRRRQLLEVRIQAQAWVHAAQRRVEFQVALDEAGAAAVEA